MSGEYRSSRKKRKGIVNYVSEQTGELKQKELKLSEIDDLLIFEGDIVVGKVDSGETIDRGLVIVGSDYRWPNATIPYTIHNNLPNQARVTDAIAHWEANTPMRFVERTTQSDYVEFIPANGCWSWVGRQGGRQELGLGGGCSTGNTIHEIGHAVGLWHEHSRADRNDFVTINWDNIDDEKEDNFDQHIADGDDVLEYDYGSIMHYGTFAFSIGGESISTPDGVTIGQRDNLSDGDIAAVVYMYGNGELFIGNKRTKELHVWNCQWVDKMSWRNKRHYWTIEAPHLSGYNGCYYCMKRWDTG